MIWIMLYGVVGSIISVVIFHLTCMEDRETNAGLQPFDVWWNLMVAMVGGILWPWIPFWYIGKNVAIILQNFTDMVIRMYKK